MDSYNSLRVNDAAYEKRISQAAVNSVGLGQWELPGALLESLGSTSGTARRLLEALVKHPENVWLSSHTVPTPHHLQWLALLTLKKITRQTTEEDKFVKFAEQAVEFRLLLYHVPQSKLTHHDITVSLCHYHDLVAQARAFDTATKQSLSLPRNCTSFLRSVLKSTPLLGHCLIKSLTCGLTGDLVRNSKLLQRLYFDTMYLLLDELKQLRKEVGSAVEEEDDDVNSDAEDVFVSAKSAKESENMRNSVKERMSCIFDYLSFLNPSFIPSDNELDRLLVTLLTFSLDFGPNNGGLCRFKPAKLYSSFLGQKNAALVTKLQEAEEFLRQNKSFDVADMDPVRETVSREKDDHKLARETWKEIFHKSLHDNIHFLEDKMEKGLSLVQSGDLEELSALLAPLEVAPLKPLLLLLAWDHLTDRGSGSELLVTLWPNEDLPSQPELCSACYRLAYQVHLVQWCMDKLQGLKGLASSGKDLAGSILGSPNISRASDMFKGLESHSVLYVLYHSTPLGELDPQEVIDVLGVSPYLLPSLPTIAGKQPPIFSPFTTPLRSTSPVSSPGVPAYWRGQSVPPPSPVGEKPLKSSQIRDISVYHAFCAIKCVMEAVHLGKTQRIGVATAHGQTRLGKRQLDYGNPKLHLNDSETLAKPLLDESTLGQNQDGADLLSAQPSINVVGGWRLDEPTSTKPLLQRAKDHILQVEPCGFQLEVLENVFSLLFLQEEDTLMEDSETHMPSPLLGRKCHSRSSTATASTAKAMFLAGESTIRDVLNILQDCIKPLSEDIRKIPRRTPSQGTVLTGGGGGEKIIREGVEVDLVNSSVLPSQLKQRFTTLKQCISEAMWRLQLLSQQNEKLAGMQNMTETPSEGSWTTMQEPDTSESEEDSTSLEEAQASSESDEQTPKVPEAQGVGSPSFVFSAQASSSSQQISGSQTLPFKRVPGEVSMARSAGSFAASLSGRDLAVRRSQSAMGPVHKKSWTAHQQQRATRSTTKKDKKRSEHDSGKEGDVEEVLAAGTGRQPRRRRRREPLLDSSTPVLPPQKSKKKSVPVCKSIVCSMLASPDSLLRSCIKYNNFARANEVVRLKMGGVKQTILSFIESYPKVCQQLVEESQQASSSFPHKLTESSAGSMGLPSKLQTAIAKVSSIAGPLQGLSKLLSLHSLEGVLFFGDAELESVARASPLASWLRECVPGLVLLDVVCTNPLNAALVHRIVKMADQGFRNKPIHKPHSSDAGYKSLESAQKMSETGPAAGSQTAPGGQASPRQLLKRLMTLSDRQAFGSEFANKCPFEMLTGACVPLHPDLVMRHFRFVKEYASAYGEVEAYLQEAASVGGSAGLDSAALFKGKMESLEATLDLCPHPFSPREAAAAVTAAVQSPELTGSPSASKVQFAHLRRFNVYLSKLAAILAEESQNEGGAKQDSLLLLKRAPILIVGELIFDCDVTPFHLKDGLAALGMDVTEMALKSCCFSPTLSLAPLEAEGKGSSLSSFSSPVIAINDGDTDGDDVSINDPCRLSCKLLSSLTKAIEGACQTQTLTLTRLKEVVASDESIAETLARSSLLRLVDFSKLNSDEKRICFFANVLNLSYLHSFIWLSVVDSELQNQLGVTEDFVSLCKQLSLSEDHFDVHSHFGLFMQCGYAIGELGTVSCYDLHCYLLPESGEVHQLLKGLPHNPVLSQSPLQHVDSLKDLWPRALSARVKPAISNGLNFTPLPKALLPASLEQVPDTSSTENSDKVLSPTTSTGFGYFVESFDLAASQSVTTESTPLPSKQQPKETAKRKDLPKQQRGHQHQHRYPLTPGVLTYIQHESELLASLAKLLCRDSGTSVQGSLFPSGSLASQALVQTLPVGQKNSLLKPSKQQQQQSSGLTSGVKGLESTVSPRSGLVSRNVWYSRGAAGLQRQASSQPLPHSWYSVDLQLEFGKFSCLQHFLEQRLVPFSEYDDSTGADSDDEDEQKAPASKSLLQSLASRLQTSKALPKEVSNSFTVDRRVALLPTSHSMLYEVCREVLLHAVKHRKPSEVLEMMNSEAYTAVAYHPTIKGLKNIAARMAFAQLARGPQTKAKSDQQASPEGSARQDYHQAVKYLSCLGDSKMAAHLVLTTLECWSVDCNVDMLSYCLSHVPPSSPLQPALRRAGDAMGVYQEILEVVNPGSSSVLSGSMSSQSSQANFSPMSSPFLIIGSEEVAKEPPQWSSWQEIKEATSNSPDQVLDLLVQKGCFDLARRWSRVHNLDAATLLKIEALFLLSVLFSEQTRYLQIYQALERFPEPSDQIQMCEEVLNRLHTTAGNPGPEFIPDVTGEPILSYLTSKLSRSLDKDQLDSYCNRATSVKILKCIPESSRAQFQGLITKPMYILEKLLMDSKLDWVGAAVAVLRRDLSLHDPEEKEEKVEEDGSEETDGPGIDHLSYPGLVEDAVDQVLTFYAVKSLDIPLSDFTSTTPKSPASLSQTPVPGTPIKPGSLSFSRAHRRTASNQSSDPATPTLLKNAPEGLWQPPHKVPRQKDWVKDSDTDKCMACRKVLFGTFHRRHHCRRCGEVVCARCSGYSLPLDGYSSRQRVCFRCDLHESRESHPEEQESDGQLYLSFAPSSILSSPQWQLMSDDTSANRKIREAFYYEQSPSTELFLSIVEFHSSPRCCAYFIMDRVDKLSLKIVSNLSGQIHKEIDYSFVIGIMKQLILKAKLMFAQVGESSGVEQCDTYMSRVTVLGLLVSARCKFTATLQDLTRTDVVRRIRDRLVQDDRYSLAIEVSTKCSLDISTVLSAWGMALIKTGEFSSAREKFATSFKIFTTKGSSMAKSELVVNVVKLIESCPLVSTMEQENDWGSMSQAGSVLFEPRQSEDCYLDKIRLQECLYYLRTYGTALQLVVFYVRHGFVDSACRLVLEKSSPPDVFVEAILIPLLKSGRVTHLEDLMKAMDPSLRLWEPYLMGACRYFSGRSLLHILYHIQLLMKDYVRAAQTCIKFYMGGAGAKTKVVDLILRKEYLHSAAKNFEAALSGRTGGSQPHANAPVKRMPGTDILKWMKIIDLQIKLIDFLDYQISTVQGHTAVSLSVSHGPAFSSSEPLPLTLFGSGQARAGLACTALLADPGLKDGFNMAVRIIQTFQLSAEDVLCHMARALVVSSRYEDVKDLLQLIQHSSVAPDGGNDKIIVAAVKALSQHTKDMKHIDRLIGLLSDEKNKVQAYIQCGKLKSAYLIAVKHSLVDQVRDIARIANQAGQINMKDICEKWLQSYSSGEVKKERKGARSLTASSRHK